MSSLAFKRENFEPVLRADDLHFSYASAMRQGEVVSGVSFDIYGGEFLCLLGPSGCGKTTLLRLIAGLEKPNQGAILSSDTQGKSLNVGMVFQDLALFPHMSVARNVGYALRHMSRMDRRRRTDEMLELVGLLDKRGAYPHELSGGQKQRLALARALARRPDLILLDEPFAAQDVTLRAKMRDDVMHILREAGVAALLVTHSPEEAMQFADRIAIMNDGKIEQIGTPDAVYNNPTNAFVASFFGEVNTLKGRVKDGVIKTPVGVIPAPDFANDTAVHIVMRPEAIKLARHDPAVDHHDPNHVHAHGIVSEKKYIGRATLVHIDTHDLDDLEAKPLHLHARCPGVFSDKAGAIEDIFLDHSQIFIFED